MTAAATARLAALIQSTAESGSGDAWGVDMVDAARRHGVAPLLYAAMRRRDLAATTEARDALARTAREEALLERVQHDELVAVLESLADAGVRVVVFKGAALAHSAYDEPWHRSRADTDLLVRREDAARAAAALERFGCRRVPRPSGEYVTHQFTYASAHPGSGALYDVHWKIADPQVFADVLTFDEIAGRAQPTAALNGALRPSDADALVIACVHRVAHHYDDDLLIRICDVDRIARRLDGAGWAHVVEVARERRVRAVCRRGIMLAQTFLAAPVPESVVRALDGGADEPSARYLEPGLRKVDILLSDLRALPNWRARICLIREHLFPPGDFVQAGEPPRRDIRLRFLYLRRILIGIRRWWRPLA